MQLSTLPKTLPNRSPTEISSIAGPRGLRAGVRILPLRIEGLSFHRDGQALLEEVSCCLEHGRSTVVLGPNGAGKSLFLRLCHGLLAPSSGRIRWLGPAANRAQAYQAMVFQRPVLLRRSVAANIDYALRIQGSDRAVRGSRVTQALMMAGLERLAGRYARILSGGEQQRLALARAWAVDPEVLFLDEPTANLDPAATRAVEDVIRIFRDTGTKVIMTTHDLGQARRLADEVLFLHRGRLLAHAPAPDFFADPIHPDAKAFLKGDLLW